MSGAFYLLMPTLPLYLTATQGLSEASVGVVLATYTLAMLLARSFSGYLVDKFPRKPLFMLGLSLFTLTFGGYIFAITIIAFMVLRFIHGITWGITTVSGSTISIDIIPSSKRGQGVGLYGLSNNLSMAVAPWIAITIYNEFGYTTLIISSITAGVLSLLTALFIKTKPHPPVEKKPISLDRFILVKALPVSLNLILCSVSYGMIVSYGVLYGKEIGIDNAGILFIFMALGIGISRIISGRFVDRGYMHRIAVFSIAALTLALVIFSLVHNVAMFYSMSLLCGVSFGTMIPAFNTLFVNMAHHNQRGTASSTYLTSFDVGMGIGMLVGGFMASRAGLYAAFLLSAVFSLISVPYYHFISKPVYERHKIEH